MLGLCLGLMFLQFLAAVPWVLAATWRTRPPHGVAKPATATPILPPPLISLGIVFAFFLGVGLFLGWQLTGSRVHEKLEAYGKGYAAVLQLQLQVDFLVLIFALMLWLWPKGGAVARAAFREGYRQPMFWLLFGLSTLLVLLSPFIPYFTFGEDYIMIKEMGFDTIMLSATAFGVLAAAMSISEEIEGRTAVTLMSKPVSRRQFLLGKFAGIFLCSLLMILIGGWIFCPWLLIGRVMDRMDPLALPAGLNNWFEAQMFSPEGRDLVRGILLWLTHIGEVIPGLVMACSLVMVLVAIAVSLATRLPMIVNLISCLIVYLLANLSPILVLSTKPDDAGKTTTVGKLLHFIAQVIDTLLPGLELFRVRPSLVDESSLPIGEYLQHVASVSLYGVLFTAVVLLVGLVLFEDRDLA